MKREVINLQVISLTIVLISIASYALSHVKFTKAVTFQLQNGNWFGFTPFLLPRLSSSS